MPLTLTSLPALGLLLGRLGVLGMAASMPISRAVFNLSALLMLIGWLLSGDWRAKWAVLRDDRSAWACAILFAAGALSLGFVDIVSHDNWGQLLVYSKLLYVPVIVTLVSDPLWNKRAWTSLLSGMLVTLTAYLLDIWFEVPGTGSYGTHTAGQGVFYHHIAQGMMLSFLGAYALHRALSEGDRRSRLLWLAVAVATAAGLIFVGQSRTGQLSVLAAYVLVVLTHLPKHLRLRGLALIGITACAMVLASPHMRDRFALALQETETFQQDGEFTSVGARLKAWELSARLIQESPWIGHGIGSYRRLAYEHFQDSHICKMGVCEQPHNQFLLTAVESGVVGVLALLVFLIAPLWNRSSPGSPAARLALPFLAIFVVTATFDSSLSIRAQAFFTLTTLGILMASRTSPTARHPQATL
jgi:O-antigen ligase